MRENLKTAVEFMNKVKRVKGILQIILFGSVARGEDKATSDIDIAIIHNLKEAESLKSEVNKIVPEKVQVVYININRLPKEVELVSALTGEGLLLYGKPLKVHLNQKELKPFVLVVYDTKNMAKKQRMLLNRALHGSVSKSRYKGKIYRSESRGVVAHAGITKLTKACLLAEPKKAVVIRNVLSLFKVKFKEELIWK